MDLRSVPIITLSLASSNSFMATRRLPRRAASKAASLTRLARSAPEKPGVPRAIVRASMSGASGTFFMCTARIFSRPSMSGASTTTWRSKRPGRSSAGSSTSGRLVAAIRITPSLVSNPPNSTASGAGDRDRAVVALDPVHLDEQLVERLLALVVPAAQPRAAVPADGVDLVDEDDARRVRLPLLEEVAHAARADADEHLHEVGARHREERAPRLAGDG